MFIVILLVLTFVGVQIDGCSSRVIAAPDPIGGR